MAYRPSHSQTITEHGLMFALAFLFLAGTIALPIVMLFVTEPAPVETPETTYQDCADLPDDTAADCRSTIDLD